MRIRLFLADFSLFSKRHGQGNSSIEKVRMIAFGAASGDKVV
jgi:hypothetical protein